MRSQAAKAAPTQLRVSVANHSDLRLVARLCRRSVGSGDYVLRILRDVIADKGLFLAWNNDALVGMTNIEKCIDGSGWLSMARTDRTSRGRGVAVFLQREIAKRARRRNIRVLRLWTSSKNTPAIRACLKSGFRPVCEATHVTYYLVPSKRPRQPPSATKLQTGGLEFILNSRYLSKMNGYVAYNWHFVKLSRELLRKLARRRELYVMDGLVFVFNKPEMIFGSRYSNFTLLDGPVTASFQNVKKTGKILGSGIIGSYIPYDRHQMKAALQAGFRRDAWGKHCIVFEKTIL